MEFIWWAICSRNPSEYESFHEAGILHVLEHPAAKSKMAKYGRYVGR